MSHFCNNYPLLPVCPFTNYAFDFLDRHRRIFRLEVFNVLYFRYFLAIVLPNRNDDNALIF